MKASWIVFLSALIIPAERTTAAEPTATLVLDLTHFRSDKGKGGVLLFRSVEGFPAAVDKAHLRMWAEIHAGRSQVTFAELPPGKYAVIAIHDENENQQLDKNFVGIPTEGYAVSNGARRRLGPPKFAQAAFPVHSGMQTVTLQIEY